MVARLSPVAWIAAGILVLQLAWTIVVPPYAGVDEFEQAYRAASVGEGYVVNDYVQAEHARGGLIRVPADVVARTRDICLDLGYPGRDGCVPVQGPDADGNVLIASVMAAYNPAYYLAVGPPARFLHGDARLYAMRVLTAVLCSGLLLLALVRLVGRARSRWPLAGLALALTPVTLYGSATVAPNGVGFVAGITAWAVVLTMMYGAGQRASDWWVLAVALGIIGSTHTTGPLWALLIGLSVLSLPRGREALARGWRERRPHLVGAAVLALGVGLLDVGWTLSQGTNLSNANDDLALGAMPWDELPGQALSWVVQTMGAVPFRNELLPLATIAATFVLFALVLGLGFRHAGRPERRVLAGLCVAFVLVGMAVSLVSYDGNGWVWQGRYALPALAGVPMLCAWILQRVPGRLGGMLPAVIWTSFVGVQTWSLVHVARHELRVLPAGFPWTPPPVSLLLGAGLAAAALVLVGLRRAAPLSVATPAPDLEAVR